jgi:hypothetical protein
MAVELMGALPGQSALTHVRIHRRRRLPSLHPLPPLSLKAQRAQVSIPWEALKAKLVPVFFVTAPVGENEGPEPALAPQHPALPALQFVAGFVPAVVRRVGGVWAITRVSFGGFHPERPCLLRRFPLHQAGHHGIQLRIRPLAIGGHCGLNLKGVYGVKGLA